MTGRLPVVERFGVSARHFFDGRNWLVAFLAASGFIGAVSLVG
jgi:hypothetical protein